MSAVADRRGEAVAPAVPARPPGPPGPPGAASAKRGSPWMVLATVMVGTLLIGLDRTVINLAIPDIIGDFDISVSTAGWLATAYIISNAVFVPVFGKLADTLGDRRVYELGTLGFLVTSVLCGLAPSFWLLVVLRILQGLVGAAVYPTALSLIARNFTDMKARTQAFGIWSASFAASIAIGPLVAGPLIDHLSWRWIFFINFPICLAAIAMIHHYLAPDRQRRRLQAFDWQGAALLGLALSALVLVLEHGRDWGWGSPGAIACYVAVAAFTAMFIPYERGVADPIVNLRLVRNRLLVSSLAISFVSFGGLIGAMFLLPVFAQQYLGYDATKTGLLLLPMALTLMVVGPLGSRVTSKFPPRVSVAAGMAIAALGVYLLSGLDVKTTALELTLPMMILATGLGLGFATVTAAATNSVGPADTGMASGILNLTRNIAGAVGIAAFATLLSHATESNVVNIAGATVINDPSPRLAAVVPHLIVLKAQVEAYGEVFAVASVVMAAGAVIALTLRDPEAKPGQRAASTAAPSRETPTRPLRELELEPAAAGSGRQAA